MSQTMYQMLSVSTGHISKATSEWLQAESAKNLDEPGGCVHAGSHGYGWFIYVHDGAEGEYDDLYPKDLVAVFEFAKSKGAEYINFDADGEEHNELPKFDWEVEAALADGKLAELRDRLDARENRNPTVEPIGDLPPEAHIRVRLDGTMELAD